MTVLLDTHSFLWFILGDAQLSPTARLLIEDPANEKFLSVASIWEMAIKVSTGKMRFHEPFETLIPQQLRDNGIEIMPISLAALVQVATLPFHHRDPFDRLLIAQSLTEPMPIIGVDTVFDSYGVQPLW